MVPGSIITHSISKIWYLLPIFLIIVLIKTPWFKGRFGENTVNFIAGLLLDKKRYHRFDNVILMSEYGTIQVEHIIVSVYGVFVVETKDMKGRISGSADDNTWIHQINKHTNRFQNPFLQNYKNVKILQFILGLKDNQIHPVIAFEGNSSFKTDMPANVTHGAGYIRYIKSKKQQVLSETEVMEIKLKIIDSRIEQSIGTYRKQPQNVKNMIREKKIKKSPACPMCGASMVLREYKSGPDAGRRFWSCVEFPGCWGSVNITDQF